MKKGIMEEFFIHNGKVLVSDGKELSFDSSVKVIYEVVRVIDGIPLFWEEHMDRLLRSAKLLQADASGVVEPITRDTRKVIELNEAPEKNLKVLLYNLNNPVPDYYVFFIKSFYPSQELYRNGIKAITCEAMRDNPHIKIINKEFRETVDRSLQQCDAYEALLLNDKGEITEGSRSNVLFVKDGVVYTPHSKDVLLGTTRAHILGICKDLGVKVVEKSINYEFLKECDGLFITGTSPKVLPISQVDDIDFASTKNGVILGIMKAFDRLIEDYIESHR